MLFSGGGRSFWRFSIHCWLRLTGQVKVPEDLTSQLEKLSAVAFPWAFDRDIEVAFDQAWAWSHNHDAVAHVDGFINVMSYQKYGRTAILPKPQHFILHAHPRECIECAKRFIEQQNFGMVNQGSSQCGPLRHATGEMVRICPRKGFKTNQPQQLIDFMTFVLEQAARNQTGLNVAANRQPRKKIWVLKNQSSLGTGPGNWFGPDIKFTGIGQIQSSDQAQESGLAAAARSDE